MCVQSAPEIETLLDLNGQIIDQGNGYWIKIEAYRVAPTGEVPHGIRHRLTLLEPYGKRILGYDNAHSVKLPQKFERAGRRLTFDHKHRHAKDHGVPCEFKDAHQLLADFFVEVDRVLSEVSEVIGPAARKSCRRNTGRGRCGTVAAALVKTGVAMVLPLPAG